MYIYIALEQKIYISIDKIINESMNQWIKIDKNHLLKCEGLGVESFMGVFKSLC